ncbi:hypothetical protein AB1K89_01635 [Sporosarcina sp. 179-K 8C2 HS]
MNTNKSKVSTGQRWAGTGLGCYEFRIFLGEGGSHANEKDIY